MVPEGAQPTIRRAPRAAAAQPPERQTAASLREEIQKSLRDPSELLSQARVIPKYEQGQMVGVQVNAIKPGSLFQEIGRRDGDLITLGQHHIRFSGQASLPAVEEPAIDATLTTPTRALT